jgi:acyl dehydratase
MSLNLDCVGKEFGPYDFEFTDKDVILYALGVGATEQELRYVFEGADGFCALPSFAVIPGTQALFDAISVLQAPLDKLLHGEQAIVWFNPVPTNGRLSTRWSVKNVFDKGKGALAVVSAMTHDSDGTPMFENTFSLFIRGEGGFGGDPGPKVQPVEPPIDKEPDLQVEQATLPWQSLLYRLNGDRNPLHASPEFARLSGFEKPILHGLCTMGFAVRHFVNSALLGDVSRLKHISCRFTAVTYPGDTIKTAIWKMAQKYVLRVTTDRGQTVISNFIARTA